MKKKRKPTGRKRKILLTLALSLSLVFGKARSSSSSSSKFGNQQAHQRLINDQELNTIIKNSSQLILAKVEWNPVTPPTNRVPSSLPPSLSGGRPIQPMIQPMIQPRYVAKYHGPSKLVDQGLGAASNPAGAGGGSGAVVPDALSVMLAAPSSELFTSRNSSNDLMLKLRGGDFSKTGPGARAKAAARQNAKARRSGSVIIPGADGFVPQNTYSHSRYYENAPLTCKPTAKLVDGPGPFQGDGGNDQPPPENPQFDSSHYKGGPNPFTDKFDYDNPNYTRENTGFSNQKRMNHSYDGHAEKCFGIQSNRNKENLQRFEKNIREYIESPETERINGSYRYETPAYHYKKPDKDLIVTVNATDNEYISVRNATDFQLEKLEIDGNLGYDSRPLMTLTLRLRGPKQ